MKRTLASVLAVSLWVFVTGCEQELLVDLPTTPDVPDDDSDTEVKIPGEGEGEGEGELEPPPPPPPPQLEESTRAQLVWKRYRAVEQDLMRGLELPKSDVCNELGRFNCVDEVHLAALGGNEPFEKSQYEPAREPTATSSIATDRVVLSACAARVEQDREGAPVVFSGLDFAAGSVDASAADAVSTELFRRLLARDPSADEQAAMRALTAGPDGAPVAPADFAALACYVVGTHVEFLFF